MSTTTAGRPTSRTWARRGAAGGLLALAVLLPAGTASASVGPLVQQRATGGDGDSWKDTRGVEYRMGLVNAPETDECYGSQATRARRALLSDGFRADSYQTDRYGRKVSRIHTRSGSDLARLMAQRGLVDDRYLARYRDEDPALARQLDGDFRAAKAARRGLWGACR